MSLPPSYAVILNDLNRDVLRARPSDPLQFCANWFNSRLEAQRASFLLRSNSTSSTLAASSVPPTSTNQVGRSSSHSPTQTSLFGDPFASNGAPASRAGFGGAALPSRRDSSPTSLDDAPLPLNDNPAGALSSGFGYTPTTMDQDSEMEGAPGQDTLGGLHNSASNSGAAAPFLPPPAFNLSRRTSVSAESLAPPSLTSSSTPSQPKPHFPKTNEQISRIRGYIASNLLFRNLDSDQYSDVLGAMKEVKYTSGKAVIEQGAQGDYFYVVDSGSLDVYIRPSGSGTPSVTDSDDSGAAAGSLSGLENLGNKMVSYGPGSSFGELALLYAQPRAASVVTTSDCVLWALDRITFRTILISANSRRRALYETFLADVPLFEHLSSSERAKISDALEVREYKAGQEVVKQGERGTEFFVIVEGEAEVRKRKAGQQEGEEENVGRLVKGDYFGELALLNNAPRAASILASRKARRGVDTSSSDSSADTLRVATLSERAFTRLLGPLAGIMGRHAEEHYGPTSTSSARSIGGVNSNPTNGPSAGLNQNIFAAGMDGLSQGVGPHDNSGGSLNKSPGDGTWVAGYSPFSRA